MAALALLPGALYVFAYERQAGAFGISRSDRLIRFLAASAVFVALFSGLGVILYRSLIVSGSLARGDVNALAVEGGCVGYLMLPAAAGTLVGHAASRKWGWAVLLGGESPEPRAWDYLWRRGPRGVVRLKLKSGTWLAGVYDTPTEGARSYASGYPEEQDLYLSLQLQVDPESGEFVRDAADRPQPVEGKSGLLLRWSEIEFLDFQEY